MVRINAKSYTVGLFSRRDTSPNPLVGAIVLAAFWNLVGEGFHARAGHSHAEVLALEQAKINLESTIQRAFTDARAALKSYEAAQLSLQSQEVAFQNSQERFIIGALNSFDLEQSRLRLINARSSLINAKYDFIFKTKVLDFYLGKR